MKLGLINLGCVKNQVDAEFMLGFLKAHGFKVISDLRAAEIIIINTCSFIGSAKKESIDTILKITRLKKTANLSYLVVAGCLVQEFGKELSRQLPEVDAFIGIGEIKHLLKNINSKKETSAFYCKSAANYLPDANQPRVRLTPSYAAYLKICDGCDNNCSYCLIPRIRGKFRSRQLTDILSEAKNLIKDGAREINLIGQDITRYGQDLYGRRNLARLLRELVKLNGLKWLRLLYTHPAHLDREVIKIIASEEKICKYVDLPLQHINDQLLRKMNRRVTRLQIERLIDLIRQEIPQVFLRTTFIVGFPGETPKIFNELCEFVSKVKFERLGVFTYSRESKTRAALLPVQISHKIKVKRHAELMLLQQRIALSNNKKLIGETLEVLIEGEIKKNYYTGRTQGDAPEVDNRVQVKSKALIRPGDFVPVKITQAMAYDLRGENI